MEKSSFQKGPFRWFATRTGKIVLAILVLLIIARIALPYVVLHFANKKLANMEGYRGHIQDISIALYRGAYTIDSIYLNKIEETGGKEDPFFSSRYIDLSLEWKSLFKGKIAGELVFDRPFLKFTEDKVELADVAKDTSDFRDLLEDFMPVSVNRCEIRNGYVLYADYTSKPVIELEATNVNAVASNLRNTYKEEEILPARLDASSDVFGGTVELHAKLNPLAETTDFDTDLQVTDVNLPELNDFFRVYANVDVNKGLFSMYMEAAAKEGKFLGYVKPFVRDLDILDWKGQDQNDGFFRKIWEGVVGLGGRILEDKKGTDKVATKIPLEGSFETGIQPNIMVAIVKVIQNAFFKSLKPSFDYEINLQKVGTEQEKDKRGLFKRIFSKDEEQK